MKRRQSIIKVTGKCWKYVGKEIYDPFYGSCFQFAIDMPKGQAIGTDKKPPRIYVRWFRHQWIPKKGEWLECTGTLGGVDIQERLDKQPQINLVLMCWWGDVKRLDKEEAP